MASVTGTLHVLCDSQTEADDLVVLLLDDPSPEVESWSRDGLEIGLTIVASYTQPIE